MTNLSPAAIESDGPFLSVTPRQLEVLALIREHGTVTRAEIGARLGSSASQVSRLTAPLIALELVTVEQRLPHAEGRPTELLALAGDTHYVIGIDIGGRAQEAVVANLRGTVVGAAQAAGPLPDRRAAIIEHLVSLVDRALADACVSQQQVLGAGAGVRAIIDPVSGVISAGPETPSWSPLWSEFDLRAELTQALPWRRVVIDDTVRALAASERRYGNAAGFDDFVYLLADSGIGAALIIEGRPYIGPGHLAGEVGHITLDHDGPLCGCGRRGCVECYASTSAMIELGRGLDPEIATIDDVIERARNGAPQMLRILETGGTALGRAVAIIINLLSPALIVLGGAAITSADYLDRVYATARAESLEQPFRAVRIVPSDIRVSSGARGAATLILDELFSASA
ncbi:MAG: ROK family transcriptional regulator, partial [Thermomicrobiales bacterium]|nr:ROK family transcriptional regulator [Thermomicrobiales bacterium]